MNILLLAEIKSALTGKVLCSLEERRMQCSVEVSNAPDYLVRTLQLRAFNKDCYIVDYDMVVNASKYREWFATLLVAHTTSDKLKFVLLCERMPANTEKLRQAGIYVIFSSFTNEEFTKYIDEIETALL